MHPAVAEMLSNFEFDHLSPRLAAISQPFHSLAHGYVEMFPDGGAELTAGLRKLLEAKDCMVRCAVRKQKEHP